MTEEKSLGYESRTRVNVSTTAKGKAQIDVTVEIVDGTVAEVGAMLNDAIKMVKQTITENDLTMAE